MSLGSRKKDTPWKSRSSNAIIKEPPAAGMQPVRLLPDLPQDWHTLRPHLGGHIRRVWRESCDMPFSQNLDDAHCALNAVLFHYTIIGVGVVNADAPMDEWNQPDKGDKHALATLLSQMNRQDRQQKDSIAGHNRVRDEIYEAFLEDWRPNIRPEPLNPQPRKRPGRRTKEDHLDVRDVVQHLNVFIPQCAWNTLLVSKCCDSILMAHQAEISRTASVSITAQADATVEDQVQAYFLFNPPRRRSSFQCSAGSECSHQLEVARAVDRLPAHLTVIFTDPATEREAVKMEAFRESMTIEATIMVSNQEEVKAGKLSRTIERATYKPYYAIFHRSDAHFVSRFKDPHFRSPSPDPVIHYDPLAGNLDPTMVDAWWPPAPNGGVCHIHALIFRLR